jgi:hypothetical protein
MLKTKLLAILEPYYRSHQSNGMSLFRRKSLEALLSQAADSEKGLKRTLGAGNLIALGIGAIIGAELQQLRDKQRAPVLHFHLS